MIADCAGLVILRLRATFATSESPPRAHGALPKSAMGNTLRFQRYPVSSLDAGCFAARKSAGNRNNKTHKTLHIRHARTHKTDFYRTDKNTVLFYTGYGVGENDLHRKFTECGIRFVAVADHVDTGADGNKKARQIRGLEDLLETIAPFSAINGARDNRAASLRFMDIVRWILQERKYTGDLNQVRVRLFAIGAEMNRQDNNSLKRLLADEKSP